MIDTPEIITIAKVHFHSRWREYLSEVYFELRRLIPRVDPAKGSLAAMARSYQFRCTVLGRYWGRGRRPESNHDFAEGVCFDTPELENREEHAKAVRMLSHCRDGRYFLRQVQEDLTGVALAREAGVGESRMCGMLRYAQQRAAEYLKAGA